MAIPDTKGPDAPYTLHRHREDAISYGRGGQGPYAAPDLVQYVQPGFDPFADGLKRKVEGGP